MNDMLITYTLTANKKEKGAKNIKEGLSVLTRKMLFTWDDFIDGKIEF